MEAVIQLDTVAPALPSVSFRMFIHTHIVITVLMIRAVTCSMITVVILAVVMFIVDIAALFVGSIARITNEQQSHRFRIFGSKAAILRRQLRAFWLCLQSMFPGPDNQRAEAQKISMAPLLATGDADGVRHPGGERPSVHSAPPLRGTFGS